MAIQTRLIEYKHGDALLEGFLAWDDSLANPQAAVAIAHAWGGRTDAECDKAIEIAKLGYVGFAIDMYGKGVTGSSVEENRALMGKLSSDRPNLQKRIAIAIDVLAQQQEVDAEKIAAIGYCFGGLCVLDLARSASTVKGVASFHGIFTAPGNTQGNTITAKVLYLHGYNDPLAPPESIIDLANEMTEAGADWQLQAYGNTYHSFTNPTANSPEVGNIYNPKADKRSWLAMQNFLEEVFS
jgi:dienelactone hydrolase